MIKKIILILGIINIVINFKEFSKFKNYFSNYYLLRKELVKLKKKNK
jgi:hypothetical protein